MILINLLPEEYRKKEAVKLALPDVPSKNNLLTIVVAVLVVQLILTGVAVYQHFIVLPGVQKRFEELAAATKDITSEKERMISLNAETKQIEQATERNFYWSSFLNTLTNSVTKGIWLRAVLIEQPPKPKAVKKKAEKKESKNQKDAKSKKEDKKQNAKNKKKAEKEAPKEVLKPVLRIRGSVYAPGQETAAVGEFLKALKADSSLEAYFSDIELGAMTHRLVKDQDVYEFEINCRLRRETL